MTDDLFGECIGTMRLCDDQGVVRANPSYPDGYMCTGMRSTGYRRYIACDNPRHYTVVGLEFNGVHFVPAGASLATAHTYAPQAELRELRTRVDNGGGRS